jgi:hypothetical protein
MKDIFDLLEKIKSTRSTNSKIEIVKQNVDNKLFVKVLTYALDSRLTFNVRRFAPYTQYGNASTEEIFDFLDYLVSKPGATKQDKDTLHKLMCVNAQTYEVVKRICLKDLRCGTSIKSVNKAIPGLIFYIPYCRCSSISKINNVSFPAYVQEKADGMFANMVVSTKGKVKFLTRDGKPVKQLKKLKKVIKNKFPEEAFNRVYHGELLVLDENGNVLDRKTGNGVLNSCIYGTAPQKQADRVIFKVWDTIYLPDFWENTSLSTYESRYNLLSSLVSLVCSEKFVLIKTSTIDSVEEAYTFYNKMRKLGKEGAVLKDKDALWKDHTSPKQIKIKNVMDVELYIVGYYKGDEGKKYKDCLGGLHCESECGLIKVNVGTGFSDEQRGYFPDSKKKTKKQLKWWESQIGKVAQLQCESVIKDKNKESHSLFLPRFVEIREDKHIADTLQDLKKR